MYWNRQIKRACDTLLTQMILKAKSSDESGFILDTD